MLPNFHQRYRNIEMQVASYRPAIRYRQYLLFLSAGLLISFQSLAVNFSSNIHIGFDDNPHSLSEPRNPLSDKYFHGDVKLSSDFKSPILFKLRLRKSEYVDDDRASWSKTYAELGYKSKFKSGRKTWRYRFSVDAAKNDKTYVSKSTGLIGSFGGFSIADRYDSKLTNFNAEVSFRNRQKTKYSFGFQHRNKDYEDFSIAGLSDLDYRHNRLKFEINNRLSDTARLVFGLSFTAREYLDRRADDLAGNDIAGTDLELDYRSYKLSYIHRVAKKIKWTYSVGIAERNDNSSGYQDSDNIYASISGRYRLENDRQLKLSLRYSDADYPNQLTTTTALGDEDDREKNGYKVNLEYQQLLNKGVSFSSHYFVELNFADFDSPNPDYIYQRSALAAGFRWKSL